MRSVLWKRAACEIIYDVQIRKGPYDQSRKIESPAPILFYLFIYLTTNNNKSDIYKCNSIIHGVENFNL